VLVLGQVLAFSHAAFVMHRTCALHGKTVHVHAPSAAPRPAPLRASVRPLATETAGHQHEHGVGMGQEHARFVPSSQPRDGLRLPALAAEPAVAAPTWPAVPVGLWALAPKHSPPT
jgi:hypothetical protein